MNILFLESDQMTEYNCSNWRCVMPHRALSRAGYQSKVIRLEAWAAKEPEAVKAAEEADIIIVQRNVFHDVVPVILYWRAKGKTVVVDLDDSYENMTEETGSPSYEFWGKGLIEQKQADGTSKKVEVYPKPFEMLTYGIKLSAGVTSPSKLICEDWEKRGVKAYWFPNYLDLSMYQYDPSFYHAPNTIHIGWGGSMTHLVSWDKSGASEALNQLASENSNLRITIIGDPRTERFFKKFHKDRRIMIGWVPHAIFGSKLSMFDIGLIPLYGEYDRRRSWIKTAEYSVMGIPWIGSDLEPTRDIDTGTRVQNTPEAWYETLKYYIENIDALKAAAVANKAIAQEKFNIDAHVGELVKLFERIIEEDK